MSVYLLDVNVLVALFDPAHPNHEDAHQWFGVNRKRGWATCPHTINGCVRALSNPPYPTVDATPAEVISRLRLLCSSGNHEFWDDAVSLLDKSLFRPAMILGHQKITDVHLLGLVVRRGGRLATLKMGTDTIFRGQRKSGTGSGVPPRTPQPVPIFANTPNAANPSARKMAVCTIFPPPADTPACSASAAFASAPQLPSWVRVCPGRQESVRESTSNRSAKGNRSLRRVRNQVAWAAVKSKGRRWSGPALFAAPGRGCLPPAPGEAP